ncbi:adhesion G-protein coupled receptor D1-like [Ptychodera flava]|uniref:adhesion G-protein coupled receptor D1-like n=1 Tax=Ptychodera flava TaxID=63121 RepID=UPI00396A19DF
MRTKNEHDTAVLCMPILALLLFFSCIEEITGQNATNTTTLAPQTAAGVTHVYLGTTDEPTSISELMQDKSSSFNATLTDVLGYFSIEPVQKINLIYYNDDFVEDTTTRPTIGDAEETNLMLSLILDVTENVDVSLSAHELMVTSEYLSDLALYLFNNIDDPLSEYKDYGDLTGLVRNFVRVAGSLFKDEYDRYWIEIRKVLYGVSDVIDKLEKFAIAISSLLSENEEIVTSGPTIKFRMQRLTWADVRTLGWVFQGFGSAQIEVDTDSLQNMTISDDSGVVMMGFHLTSLTDYMGKNKTKHATVPNIKQASVTNPEMLSNETLSLMMIKYPDLSETSLPVTYKMDHMRKLSSNQEARCTFWNFTRGQDVGGIWDDRACTQVTRSADYTECACAHTTTFGLIVIENEILVHDPHSFICWVIIWACGIFSIVPYIILLAVAVYLTTLNRRRRLCLINFCVASIMALVLLMCSEAAKLNQWACMAVNILMHMTLLSVFFWIMAIGLHVSTKTTSCSRSEVRSLHMIIIGWALPFVTTGVTAGVRYSAFGKGKDCWMNASDPAVQGLLFPALFAAALAAITLGIGLRAIIMSGKFMLFEREKDEINKMKGLCIIKLAVIPILLLVWGLGYMSFKGITGLNYLFALLVSFHGIPVVVLHLKLNGELKQARELLEEEKRKKEKEKEQDERPVSSISRADSTLTLEDYYSDEDEWDEWNSEYGSRPETNLSNTTTITTRDIDFDDDYGKRRSAGQRNRGIYGNPEDAEEFMEELRKKLESPGSRDGTPDSRTESARSARSPSPTKPVQEEPDEFVKAYLMRTRGEAWLKSKGKMGQQGKKQEKTDFEKKTMITFEKQRPKSRSDSRQSTTSGQSRRSVSSSRAGSRADSRPKSNTSNRSGSRPRSTSGDASRPGSRVSGTSRPGSSTSNQRRNTSRPGSRTSSQRGDASRPGSTASSRPGSNTGSRPGSNTVGRPGSKTSKKEARSVSQLSGLGVIADEEEEYDPGEPDYGEENEGYDDEDEEYYSDEDDEGSYDDDEEYDEDEDYDDEEEEEEEEV